MALTIIFVYMILKKFYNSHLLTLDLLWFSTTTQSPHSPCKKHFSFDVSTSIFPRPPIVDLGSRDTHDHWILFVYFDKS